MPKGTRVPMLTDTQIKELERMAAFLTIKQIAYIFGMNEDTLYNRMIMNKEIRAAFERGKAVAIANVANSLLTQALSGNTTAMIFYLKTQGRWKEHHVLEVGSLANKTDEELAMLASGDEIE